MYRGKGRIYMLSDTSDTTITTRRRRETIDSQRVFVCKREEISEVCE